MDAASAAHLVGLKSAASFRSWAARHGVRPVDRSRPARYSIDAISRAREAVAPRRQRAALERLAASVLGVSPSTGA